MAKRQATEDEIMALMESDEDSDSADQDTDVGDEGEEPSAEDDGDESGDEQEEEEETAGDDEETEEVEETDEEEIDWSKVDPKIKAAYEKAAEASQKWEKSHNRLQSKFHKSSQAQRHNESVLAQAREKAELYDRLEALLERNPKLQQELLGSTRKSAQGGFRPEAPKFLQEDPMFQYFEQHYAPYIGQLEAKIAELGNQTKGFLSKSQNSEAEQRLSMVEGAIRNSIKSTIGRDASDDDIEDILEYMNTARMLNPQVDAKVAQEIAETAVLKVFRQEYENSLKKQYQSKIKDKSKKFGVRTKTANSALTKGKRGQHADTPEEAIAMALAEQGIE